MINRKNRTLLLCYRKSRRYAQSRCNAVGVSCNRSINFGFSSVASKLSKVSNTFSLKGNIPILA